jgi:hypothetical protein
MKIPLETFACAEAAPQGFGLSEGKGRKCVTAIASTGGPGQPPRHGQQGAGSARAGAAVACRGVRPAARFSVGCLKAARHSEQGLSLSGAALRGDKFQRGARRRTRWTTAGATVDMDAATFCQSEDCCFEMPRSASVGAVTSCDRTSSNSSSGISASFCHSDD